MCGLAGILGNGAAEPDMLRRMARSILHRGPDDEGIWCDAAAGIGLAHRRLSIVDLSPMGHQPMASADERFVLAYNGEIYNHLAIRAALEADGPIAWRGHSDTETLVEAVARWGLRRALKQAAGMFALALWDRRERRLMLARDRFGEKPLYYGWTDGDFVFASELKAIRCHPRFDNGIDRRALRLLAARTYIPAPLSIYEGLFKLEPGTILTVTTDAAGSPSTVPIAEGERRGGLFLERYWSYRDAVVRGLADPIGDEQEALDRLEAALKDAIAGQAVADVPVGAFLSGGIDSSTIVALYQAHSPGRVKSFSIGFREAGFDEAAYARAVAEHLGTEHHEQYVSAEEAREVIPALPSMYDEPYADSSQIPTYLVSAMARRSVTVSLSGDGGDELFGGYNRYLAIKRVWSQLKRLPRPVRAALGSSFASVPAGAWNGLAAMLPSGRRPAFFGTRVNKLFRTMRDANSVDDVMGTFLDEWQAERSPVLPPDRLPAEGALDMALGADAPDVVRMMYCDAVSYLPDDILCKVDRAAMAVSLETRVPFLDHRVAEVAARIPLAMKIEGGTGKAILRKLLHKHVPARLFDRPKAGFAVPVGDWLKGPLRDWAEDLLEPGKLAADGFLDTVAVRRRWESHLSGRADGTGAIWTVLMFQAWLNNARNGHEETRSKATGVWSSAA